MALNFGKRDTAKVVEVLDGEYETVDQAAAAVIAKVVELYEGKAKFAVAGQLRYSGDAGYMDVEDERASKIIVGPFGTETQALNAMGQLKFSSATGEEFRAFTATYWHGTPAAYYQGRNRERKDRELAARSPFEQECARRAQWFTENPGRLTYEPDPERGAWVAAHSAEGLADCTHICNIHQPAGLVLTGKAV